MTPEQFRQLDELYSDLADLSPEKRAPRINAVADPEVRRELEAMLSHSSGDATGLATAIGRVVEAASEAGAFSGRQERFGHYQLIRRIGQGGMGVVYEAARVDDFHKRVALKIVRQGLDSDYARARFLQERQTLAGLEHPAITRLLDGGETEDGSPYLVMEFVDGQPVTDYSATLDRTGRLRLFLKICEAVEYAHRNLVVHRDLKPANILVTADGEPKLLDFGIAKLLQTDGSQTQTAVQALTPDYASPEQVRGEAITTASDVYSLGVILYQMLTDRKPYTLQTSTLMEMEKVICLQPPQAPGLGEELDQILLMALRKEPARRYGSVREFADDVERLLEHRPVIARGDSLSYRAGKFLRRNRSGVAATVILLGVVAAAFVVTVRSERLAQARFEDVRKLATSFLVDFDRDIRQLPGSTAARERLVSTGLQHLDRLAQNASRDPKLMFDLAGAYAAFADVQGMPGLPNLGRTDLAEQSYRKSCDLTDRLLAIDSSPSSPYRTRATFSYSRLGYLLWRMRRVPEAKAMMLKAASLIEPKVNSPGVTADDLRAAANTWGYIAPVEQRENRPRAALDAAAKSLEFMTRYQAMTPGLRARANLARSVAVTSQTATSVDLAQALQLRDRSDEILRGLFRENPNDMEVRRELAISLQFRARILDQDGGPCLGRTEEAVGVLEEAIGLHREMTRLDPRNMTAKAELAMAIEHISSVEAGVRPARAAERLKESLSLMQSLPAQYAGKARETGIIFLTLARASYALGRKEEARAALARAEASFQEEKKSDNELPALWRRLWGLTAEMRLQDGDTAGAIELFSRRWQGLADQEGAAAENLDVAFPLAAAAAQLARSYSIAGDHAKAAEWTARRDKIWQPWQGKYPVLDLRLRADGKRTGRVAE